MARAEIKTVIKNGVFIPQMSYAPDGNYQFYYPIQEINYYWTENYSNGHVALYGVLRGETKLLEICDDKQEALELIDLIETAKKDITG